MTAAQIAFYIFFGTPQERARWKTKAHSFCERHLIADDPYDEQTQDAKRKQDPPPKEENDDGPM